MDKRLYLERWLLEISTGAAEAGLAARVRALDGKGGRLLGLAVRHGDEALEFRYWKRRTGARRVVAATGAEIVGRVREVHASIGREHRRVLENGFRRFLKRSIRMLEGLESAFFREPDLLERLGSRLTAAKAPPSTRAAAVARRSRGAPGGYEVLPAAVVVRSSRIWFTPLLEGGFVDLSSLVRPPEERRERWDWGIIDPVELVVEAAAYATLEGVELIAWPSALADAAGGLADAGAPAAVDAAGSAVEAAGGAVASVAETGGQTVEAAGSAVAEVASGAASILGDAACAGVDCGGIDCIPL